jgi:crotonobetainyl-CoA:carnitine CoA-transferase CaiB-like acyl-CoA transferase
VFRTGDDHWVTLAGSTNALFAANCRAIGRPDLIDDPRFATNDQRVRHAAELNDLFAAWCAAHPLDVVLARFNAAQGTLAPIYSIDQIADDPQVRAREVITRVADRDFGTVAMTNAVPRFTVDPARLRHAAGDVGQDNDEVFRNWLGLSDQEIEQLTRRKVI